MTTEFAIGGRAIGPGRRVYCIAEISSNHGQDRDAAVRIVRGAAAAGADAVKLLLKANFFQDRPSELRRPEDGP